MKVGKLVNGPRLGLVWVGLVSLLTLAVGAWLAWTPSASAQPEVEWSRVLGGDADDFAHAVVQSTDGGYVVAGETASFGAGGKDAWLVKLDGAGEEQWRRTFGGPQDDVAYDLRQTADGGYVIAGATSSSGDGSSAESDFWLVKTDASGEEEWQRTYGNIGPPGVRNLDVADVAHAVRQTSDGGYILAGWSLGSRDHDAWVVKADAEGDVQWSRQFGGQLEDKAYDIIQTTDGGYAVAGQTASSGSGGSDFWLVKTNSQGFEEWASAFGGQYNDEARAVSQTIDGGYALGGYTWSYGVGLSDFWLVKADSSGAREWDRTHGGLPRDAAHSLQETTDGGLVLAGWSESFSGGDQIWMVKTSPFGNTRWTKAYRAGRSPATEVSGARAAQLTADGGFVIAGWTGPQNGVRDISVIKVSPEASAGAVPTGPAVVLTNTGTASITTAAVGLDTQAPGHADLFWYEGRLLDWDNPLQPGELACTQPIPELASGSHLVRDQVSSFTSSYLDVVTATMDSPRLHLDESAFSFSLASPQGVLAGEYTVVSVFPCPGATPPAGGIPAPPSGVTVAPSPDQTGSLVLDWDEGGEAGLAGYGLYVSEDPAGPYARRVSLFTGPGFTDTGLREGVAYYYAVTAITSRGEESPKSPVVSATPQDLTPPALPSGLHVTRLDPETGLAQLAWDANTEKDLFGYRVYRQDEDGARAPVSGILFSPAFEDRAAGEEDVVTYTVTAVDTNGNESGSSNIAPPERDFFGTVMDVQGDGSPGGSLLLNTGRGNVLVLVDTDTEFKVPYVTGATVDDLAPGDTVAVMLMLDSPGTLPMAEQVFLVPAKTRVRHVSGRVVSVSATELVVQPTGGGLAAITFQLSESTEIKYHRGITELGEGAFVIVATFAESPTGQLSPVANEINVTPGPDPQTPLPPRPEPTNVAVLRGIFEGINPGNANLVLSSTEVTLDVHTEMAAALVVGELIEVLAELRPDGSLLALRVDSADQPTEIPGLTTLQGFFQGGDPIDRERWLVSGVGVDLGSRTYTDGRPQAGQLVKVTAVLQEDGFLLAREIENQAIVANLATDEITLTLEGPFQGAERGSWIIGGVRFDVDAATVLEGSPSVGRRVSVTAKYDPLGLLATRVSAEELEKAGAAREARIRGTVDSVEPARSIVVDGLLIGLSDLTEFFGDIAPGTFVQVRAVLNTDGTLVAREVVKTLPEDETGEARANLVDIRGRIEEVREDGSLLVNGIAIVVSALTDIDAQLRVGTPVQVRGLLQGDGSVLAREISGQGLRGPAESSEVRLDGVVQSLNETGGQVVSFVVDRVTVSIDELTRTEVSLAAGISVSVHAVVIDGEILAVTVEPNPTGVVGVRSTVEVQGPVESKTQDEQGDTTAITINGLEIRIGPDSRVRSPLTAGEIVKVVGMVQGGVLVAEEISRVETQTPEDRPARFRIEGLTQEVRRDEDGGVTALVVDGEEITTGALTVFEVKLEPGIRVTVEGRVVDGALVATLVTGQTSAEGPGSGSESDETE